MLIDKDKISAVGQDLTSLSELLSSLPPSLCAAIKCLFLSNNLLSSLREIHRFSSIEILSVSNNRLVYFDSIASLSSLARSLRRLSLLGNPVIKLPFYREYCISLCPQLESLDGQSVSDLDRVQAKLRVRQYTQFMRRACDNVARNGIATHILRTISIHIEMRRKVFCRMRFLHHKQVGHLSQVPLIDPGSPTRCDTTLLFRLLRESGVLDDFLVASTHIERCNQNDLYKLIIEMSNNKHKRMKRDEDFSPSLFEELLSRQEKAWMTILQAFSDLAEAENSRMSVEAERGVERQRERQREEDLFLETRETELQSLSRSLSHTAPSSSSLSARSIHPNLYRPLTHSVSLSLAQAERDKEQQRIASQQQAIERERRRTEQEESAREMEEQEQERERERKHAEYQRLLVSKALLASSTAQTNNKQKIDHQARSRPRIKTSPQKGRSDKPKLTRRDREISEERSCKDDNRSDDDDDSLSPPPPPPFPAPSLASHAHSYSDATTLPHTLPQPSLSSSLLPRQQEDPEVDSESEKERGRGQGRHRAFSDTQGVLENALGLRESYERDTYTVRDAEGESEREQRIPFRSSLSDAQGTERVLREGDPRQPPSVHHSQSVRQSLTQSLAFPHSHSHTQSHTQSHTLSVPPVLSSLSFSKISRSLEVSRSERERERERSNLQASVDKQEQYEDMRVFVAKSRETAIEDVLDDVSESLSIPWEEATVRIQTVADTLREIYPNTLHSSISTSFQLTDLERQAAYPTSSSTVSLAEYKHCVASLSRKLVIAQRELFDARKASQELQTESLKCRDILTELSLSAANSLTQLRSQVVKFKASYPQKERWIVLAEQVENQLEEAKEALVKAQKRSQALEQLTQETQKAIEDEHHFSEDLRTHAHSVEESFRLLDGERASLRANIHCWPYRFAVTNAHTQSFSQSHLLTDALFRSLCEHNTLSVCVRRRSLLRTMLAHWRTASRSRRSLSRLASHIRTRTQRRLTSRAYHAWWRLFVCERAVEKLCRRRERAWQRTVLCALRRYCAQSRAITQAHNEFTKFRKRKALRAFLFGVSQSVRRERDAQRERNLVVWMRTVRLLRAWRTHCVEEKERREALLSELCVSVSRRRERVVWSTLCEAVACVRERKRSLSTTVSERRARRIKTKIFAFMRDSMLKERRCQRTDRLERTLRRWRLRTRESVTHRALSQSLSLTYSRTHVRRLWQRWQRQYTLHINTYHNNNTAYFSVLSRGWRRWCESLSFSHALARMGRTSSSSSSSLRLLASYVVRKMADRLRARVFRRWRALRVQLLRIRQVVQWQQEKDRQIERILFGGGSNESMTATNRSAIGADVPSNLEKRLAESTETIQTERQTLLRVFTAWHTHCEKERQLRQTYALCLSRRQAHSRRRVFSSIRQAWGRSLSLRIRDMQTSPICLFYNDRLRYAKESERERELHEHAVDSLRRENSEKEREIDALRVAIAALSDSLSAHSTATQHPSLTDASTHTKEEEENEESSSLAVRDMEYSLAVLRRERDNLHAALTHTQSIIAKEKETALILQNEIEKEKETIAGASAKNGENDNQQEVVLPFILAAQEQKIARDFRWQQLEDERERARCVVRDTEREREALQRLTERLSVSERETEALVRERLRLQELVCACQLLLQQACNKIANEMKIFENEFDIIAEEKALCVSAIVRCQSEESRCKRLIESIAQAQRVPALEEEMRFKMRVDRTRIEAKLLSPSRPTSVVSSRKAVKQSKNKENKPLPLRETNANTIPIKSPSHDEQSDASSVSVSDAGSVSAKNELDVSTNSVSSQIDSLSKRLRERLANVV